MFLAVGVIFGTLAQAEDEEFETKLKKARAVPEITKNDKGGGFFGAGASLGQTYTAEPKGSPGFGFLMNVTPGFIMQNTSFYRAEIMADVVMGSLSFKEDKVDYTLAVSLGVIPKFGYGYSITDGLMGVLNLHAGAVNGNLEGKISDGKIKADPAWGFAYGLGYDFVFEASKSVEFLAGFNLTHLAFNFKNQKFESIEIPESKVVNLNYSRLTLGARYRF
jgi:hypothetical protein